MNERLEEMKSASIRRVIGPTILLGSGSYFTARKEPVASDATLEIRLADCLADAVDTTLLTVRDTLNDYPVELRLGSFNREISERAAELLEEAGR